MAVELNTEAGNYRADIEEALRKGGWKPADNPYTLDRFQRIVRGCPPLMK